MINNIDIILSAYFNKDINEKYLTTQELNYLLSTDYSDAYKAYKNGCSIFRGQSAINDIFLTKSKTRLAQNTNNIVNRLTSSIIPSWKNYPKRNHSFICTNSAWIAEKYLGQTYLIFPKNGTNIGICPKYDFWISFETLDSSSIDDFNYFFMQILSMLNNKTHDEINKCFNFGYKSNIVELLNKTNEIIINNKKDIIDELNKDDEWPLHIQFIKNISKNRDIFKVLDDFFNPEVNKFSLTNISNYNLHNEIEGKEVWFDGEAIFVSDILQNLIK